jgi:subtilisin-like proprotein convertase family protein
MELLVEGSMQNNFVSLTAPAYEDSGRLFKWNNDFAWSYNGNITDSIKEKVKAAGGNVTNAKLRVSLAWFNFDDLDIHITEPGGNRIYFGNRSGKLDVDMNAGRGTTRTPVENVSWTVVQDGRYKIEVDQFSRRETADNGFVIEIENAGRLSQFSYKSAVTGRVQVGNLEIRNGVIEKFTPGLGMVGGSISQEKWGVSTEKYAVVNTVMYSPNYWDDNAVGNKHWFFMLDKCLNDQPTRGIYNEFLNGNFEKHRKVFELLGDKTKCPVDDANGKPVEQLSGLGFSSTKGDSVKIQVTNNNNGVTGVYQIQF